MFTLDEELVESYKKDILEEDEAAIRSEFGFRKNIEKYPLLYKEAGGGTLAAYEVKYIGLISRGEDKNVASLLIGLEDGRYTRICSMYLNEMQASDWGMELVADDGEVDSLFE